MKIKAGEWAKDCENLKCPDCSRYGCWMTTNSKKYVTCKCGCDVAHPLYAIRYAAWETKEEK